MPKYDARTTSYGGTIVLVALKLMTIWYSYMLRVLLQ